ncbi:hypothetical protein BKA67DRAFT_554026 [Truncatella angustata]|uniref:Uncharacterized protein n=1 Tax=Truncatella angustata TaxID=152316 RepID=A0A9P8US46_9PEZI|nr:uncharacterized protein BKA67DRAFT_554026 [Truncatella angustata]KAH6657030.1 hypothetical protein BKA67DRAFT_554026 [Truncatella angustata]
MAEKRSADTTSDQPGKRHRFNGSSNSSKRHGQGVDETYGQRFAFGNLDAATIPNDRDLEWEDESDALAYLKFVRNQAEGIPHVLVAKKSGPELPTAEDGTIDRSIYEDGRGDFRGYYHDGAYTALPAGYDEEGDEDDEYRDQEGAEGDAETEDAGNDNEIKSEESSIGGPRNSNSAEIHEAYYIALSQQYHLLRTKLRSKPPSSVVSALPPDHPTEVGGFGASPSPFKQWSSRLTHTDPLPAQIASMHKDSVLRLLRIVLNGKFFRRGQEVRERTSRWIWALLARLPEKGELDYQDIGVVRELGKRAVLFMLSLAEADVLQEQFGVGSSGGNEDVGEVEVEEAEEASADGEDESGSHNASKPEDGHDTKDDNTKSQNQSSGTMNTDEPRKELSPAASGIPSPPSDVEMEIDSDEEDGEVSSEPQSQSHNDTPADIETAKARLLAQLETQDEERTESPSTTGHASTSNTALGEITVVQETVAAKTDVNVRATLNMILTVAGEFYGQRDLLEFRDPFGHNIEG